MDLPKTNNVVSTRQMVSMNTEVINERQISSTASRRSISFLDEYLATAFAQEAVPPIESASAHSVVPNKVRFQELQAVRQKLPVWKYKDEFFQLLENNRIIIVEGETGCGKTTQIPQWCVEYTNKKQAVACTQPRRLAATSIAERVAEEMGVKLGEEVGYHIRFDDRTSQKTILKYMTDGVLLRQIESDATLYQYGIILLDETHERGTFADVLMGLLKKTIKVRNDLCLIIMSATLDVEKFKKYFHNPPILKIPGRLYPIEIIYSSRNEWNSAAAAYEQVKKIHESAEKRGDILVFMAGQGDIDKTCYELELWTQSPEYHFGELRILPLYSDLPKEDQDLVFEPAPLDTKNGISRKVIVATNIAETSVTIDGIVYVIDSGYMNVKIYNRETRANVLSKVRTTQTNARQRAGRAGRTQPGKCFRLYTEQTFIEMEPFILPEVMRSNLSAIALDLKRIGVKNIFSFKFMDPPEDEALNAALKELRQLKALDQDNNLTQLGADMAAFPLDPRVSKVIVGAFLKHNCCDDILSIAAMLSVPQCFVWNKKKQLEIYRARRQFVSDYGDHIMLLKLYKAYKANGECQIWCRTNFVHYRHLKFAVEIRSQIKAILQTRCLYRMNEETCDRDFINIRKALLSGFYLQFAHTYENRVGYMTLYDHWDTVIYPYKQTGLSRNALPPLVIYDERLTLAGEHYICIVTPIESSWWDEVVAMSVKDLKSL